MIVSGKNGRRCLGWCPKTCNPQAAIPHMKPETRENTPGGTPAGRTPVLPAVTDWMTAVSILVLFATCFVGGNPGWPVLVLIILAVFIYLHIRSLQTTTRC